MNVAVNRLTLRGTCDAPHHQAFLVEDALRTQLSSESRLVVVRTLSLLPVGTSPQRAQDSRLAVAASVADGWSRIMAHSCHGGSDSAAGANVVWFRDAAEARMLLLDRLLKGHAATAWYWPLAVKHWHGQPIEQWIAEELLDEADPVQQPSVRALLTKLLDAGAVEIAGRAIALHADTPFWAAPSYPLDSALSLSNSRSQSETRIATTQSPDATTQAEQAIASIAAQIVPTLPRALLSLLLNLKRSSASPEGLVRLTARFIAGAMPELRLKPDLLFAVAQRIIADELPAMPRAKANRQKSQRHDATLPKADGAGSTIGMPTTGPQPVLSRHDSRSDIPQKGRAPHRQTRHDIAQSTEVFATRPTPLSEQPSLGAGLFFLIAILRELDWPRWLMRHPELLGHNPTAQLLQHCARHYRIDASDPLYTFLGERLGEPEAIDPTVLRFWRGAADKWLRRKTRIALGNLVRRPGWLDWHGDRIDVRFASEAADIRLRRLALDRDPGWTDWAGLCLYFHYRDSPLSEGRWT